MRAIVQTGPGGLDQLRLDEATRPEPGPGQACMRLLAVGLNPVDWKLTAKGHPAWDWPHIAGVDGCGEVVAIGPDTPDHWLGRRVAWHGDLTAPGTFAEFACAPAACLAALPDGLEPTAAAAIPCAGLTAYQLIARKLPDFAPGACALVHAGAGGVGGFAIQLLSARGLRVFTTCSPDNAEHVTRLGAEAAIDYRSEDVSARVRELTAGRGVELAINTIDRDSATADLTERLAFGGHLCFVAGQPHFDRFKPFSVAPSFHEAALGAAHWCADETPRADLGKLLSELLHMVAAGRLDPLVSEELAFADIPAGLHRISERHVRGKLVARVG